MGVKIRGRKCISRESPHRVATVVAGAAVGRCRLAERPWWKMNQKAGQVMAGDATHKRMQQGLLGGD